MIVYQRVELVPPADVGPPNPLPADLVGLDDASLADVTAAIGVDAATQLGYLNTGFLPVVFPDPPQPITVTNSQLRIALSDAGLLDDVDAAVALEPVSTQIRWQYNSLFSQSAAWVVALFVTAGVPLEPTFAAAQAIPPD